MHMSCVFCTSTIQTNGRQQVEGECTCTPGIWNLWRHTMSIRSLPKMSSHTKLTIGRAEVHDFWFGRVWKWCSYSAVTVWNQQQLKAICVRFARPHQNSLMALMSRRENQPSTSTCTCKHSSRKTPQRNKLLRNYDRQAGKWQMKATLWIKLLCTELALVWLCYPSE